MSQGSGAAQQREAEAAATTGASPAAGAPQAADARPTRLAALITAYHPDERLAAAVDAALADAEAVVVVDNTPGGSPLAAHLADRTGVEVLGGGENLGLAAALNRGLAALPPGPEAVFFLDQDSRPPVGLAAALAALLADPTVAVAAPTAWDAAHDRPYRAFGSVGTDVADRDIVITSGMLVRRSVLDRIGGFREDFFVDYADLDFCLRVGAAGGRLVEDKRLRMPHAIGERREHRLLGVVPVLVVHHPAWRQYWMGRNGLILIRENLGRNPHWALVNTLFLARWFAVTALFAEQRGAKTAALLRGFADGVTGRARTAYLPSGASYRPATRRSSRTPSAGR